MASAIGGTNLQPLLNDLIAKYKPMTGAGRVASYIPELSKADRNALGIAVADATGVVAHAGDTSVRFTMQSASKPFALALALLDNGPDVVFSRIGMEPTGDSFNSLMRLETFSSLKPVNPLVNAGAIATTALIKGNSVTEKFGRLTEFIRTLAPGCHVGFNADVYRSESESGDRNRAIAYFLRDIKALLGSAEDCLDLYFRQCSLEVDCFTLATLGGALAACHSEVLLPREYCRIIRTFMFTCGMYNASGEFSVKVGFPAKSGVSGAVLGVVPGRCGLGVYGPALDTKGNSVGGVALLTELSARENLYIL